MNVYRLYGSAGRCKYYRWYVYYNSCNLKVKLYPGTAGRGNADLYAHYDSSPTTTSYDYRSNGATSTEEINIKLPRSGHWHFAICGVTSFSGLEFQGIFHKLVSV